MTRHVRDECGGQCKFICSVCNKQFSQKGNLRSHISMIHKPILEFNKNVHQTDGDRNFCTNNGGRSYKYKCHMIAHVRNECDGQHRFICSVCNKHFSQKGNLRTHISMIHTPILEFDNNVQRTDRTQYFCTNNCGRSYKYKGNMIAHVRNECGGQHRFICSFCNKQFSYKGNLRSHISMIHNPILEFDNNVQRTDRTQYFCTNNCGRSYKYKGNMIAHVRNECGGQHRFICSFCNKQFSYKGNLRSHISMIHNPILEFDNNVQRTDRTQYFCTNNCGRSYKYKCNMIAHVRNECGGQHRFICSVCNKQFSHKGNLRSHISMVHKPILKFDNNVQLTDTTRYFCTNNCGRSYKFKYNMTRHVREGCGVQCKFICSVCNKQYSRKRHLRTHISMIHTPILDLNSATYISWTKNSSSSSSREVFYCPKYCGRFYEYRHNMLAHLKYECGE